MDLKSYLDEAHCHYQWSVHSNVFTARTLASAEHVPSEQVVKPVLVKIDGEFVLCALPASYRVDLNRLRTETGAENADLADETDLRAVCSDCEVGAEPPIGWLFGLATLMDESLFADAKVTFQAGTHREAITMPFMEYYRLARPVVGSFGQQV